MKKIFTVFFGILLLFTSQNLIANDKRVPNVIAYQSVIYDDGGNLLPDEKADVRFKITDALGNIAYEEQQSLDVVHGQISALVGNGVLSNGAPTGGISSDHLNPDNPYYLEVSVNDLPPLSPMEITSVPYAMYADVALGVADESITGKSIANETIQYEDLNKNLISKLSDEITLGKGSANIVFKDELETLYRNPSSAENIGVKSQFIYSGENDLQGVLKDLDIAIKSRDEKITSESQTRQSEDITMKNNIAAETIGRQNADTALQNSVNSEAATRAQNDQTLESGKLSKSGGTITGGLIIQEHSGSISLNGVMRTSWSGLQNITRRSTSKSFGNDTNWEGCIDLNGGFVCSVSVSCNTNEILLSCAGNTDEKVCWGEDACQFYGTILDGNSCIAKAGQIGIGDLMTIKVFAVCGELY